MSPSRTPRRMLPALLLVIALAGCSSSTSTPAVDSKLLQERLDQFVTAVTKPEAGSEFSAKAEGTSKVETASDGSITGTLPRLTFTNKEGGVAVLDPITLHFANGGDGVINVDAKIPSSLAVKDKDGKVQGEVQIGSQTLKGVWVEKLQTLNNVEMRLSNLAIKSSSGEGSGTIGQIALTGKLDPTGGGLYDGKYDLTMTGFVAEDATAKTTTRMDNLSVVSTIKGARMEDWAKAAKEAGYTLANPDLFKAWSGGKLDPKMIAFMKRMPEFMGDMSYTYNVAGIDVKENGKQTFGLKSTSLGFGASGDGKGTTKVRMTFSLGGFSGGPDQEFLPAEADVQNATLDMDASGVPGKKLWDIYMDALPQLQAEAAKAASQTAGGQQTAANAGTAALEEVGGEMSGKFMEVMSAAKLSIALNQLSMITPTAKMAGKGAMSYLPAQSIMPEGKVSLRFTGIDALAKAMEKRGKKDEMAQQIMGIAAGVRAMGKPDPTSPATDRAYIIDIVMGKDGSITANGQKLWGG
ncbi:MAG: hypothetical protein ABL973_16240 [Micropepsaceae bacterium]